MAEYIEREALCKILENWRDAHADVDDEHGCGLLEDVLWEVNAQTTVDAVSVVRGWWESVDSSYWRWTPSGGVSVSHITYRCGRCGRGTAVKTNYCPNCGAKMDVEE